MVDFFIESRFAYCNNKKRVIIIYIGRSVGGRVGVATGAMGLYYQLLDAPLKTGGPRQGFSRFHLGRCPMKISKYVTTKIVLIACNLSF